MAKITLTIIEMKLKTREMLGLSEDEDLSFIDDDFINADANTNEKSVAENLIPSPNYGTQLAYGHRDGVGPTYEFRGGSPSWATNVNDACKGGRWWLSQSLWNHDNESSYCGGSGQPAFRRISKFTYTG